MSKESIQGPLSALRNAGTVSGLCLTRGTEVLINMLPYSDRRVEDLASVIDDVFYYFENSRRDVDQFAFGFDGANMVVVTEGDFRLLIVHLLADEIDFIAKAARAFLIDFQLGLFAEELDARNAAGDSSAEETPESADETPSEAAEPEDREETSSTPVIRPLAPAPAEEDKTEPEETADAASEPEPEARPVPETARVPRMEPSIPAPTAIAWSARREYPAVPPPVSLPVSEAPPGSQPKPTSIRTHRFGPPEEEEKEPPAAQHRAHLAPSQPESTLPPRRMPRR